MQLMCWNLLRTGGSDPEVALDVISYQHVQRFMTLQQRRQEKVKAPRSFGMRLSDISTLTLVWLQPIIWLAGPSSSCCWLDTFSGDACRVEQSSPLIRVKRMC